MGEPPVTLQAFHHDGPGNLPPTRVVIHATVPGVGYPGASAAGMAASTARYFQLATSGGSAHYIVDIAGEQHCVADNTTAWHAPPNIHSLGIEICAESTYTREQWLSPAVWPAVLLAAARTADLCARYNIPLAYVGPAALIAGARGICGHVDVSNAWHQTDHTDPGPGFPWPEFLTAVVAASATGDDVAWSDQLPDLYPGAPKRTIDAGTQLAFANAHAAQALDAANAALALCRSMAADLAAIRAKVGA